MALDKTVAATAAVAAENALPVTATAQQRLEAFIGAIFDHIKANMVVTSQVASSIPVATTGTAVAQTGATTAPGTATSTGVV